MNDDEELDYGGHNGGWRSPYPWWRTGWNRRPILVPVPVQAQASAQQLAAAYRAGQQSDPCPDGYYMANGQCYPLDRTSQSQLGLGVAVAGLAALTVFLLVRR